MVVRCRVLVVCGLLLCVGVVAVVDWFLVVVVVRCVLMLFIVAATDDCW